MNSEQNGQQMVQQIASAFMGEVGKKEQKGKEAIEGIKGYAKHKALDAATDNAMKTAAPIVKKKKDQLLDVIKKARGKAKAGKETAKTFGIGTKTNDQGLKR